jgi:hypothetical protein
MGGIKKDEKVDKKCSMGGFFMFMFSFERKCGPSDSGVSNVFHRVQVINYATFLV